MWQHMQKATPLCDLGTCPLPPVRSPKGQPCDQLFCPLYSLAGSPDPLMDAAGGNGTQLHIAVGLDSGTPAAAGVGCSSAGFTCWAAELAQAWPPPTSAAPASTWCCCWTRAAPWAAPLTRITTIRPQGSRGSSPPKVGRCWCLAVRLLMAGKPHAIAQPWLKHKALPARHPVADRQKTKMDVAKEVLAGVVDLLAPEDALGVVLFRWLVPMFCYQWARQACPSCQAVSVALCCSDGACIPRRLAPLGAGSREGLKRQVSTCAAHPLASPPPNHPGSFCPACCCLAQMQRDIRDTSGTNMQSGLDAGERDPVTRAQPHARPPSSA